MKLLLCLILFTFTVAAQEAPKSVDEIKPEPSKCVHEDDESFYNALRHSGPVTVTHADGRSITVVIYKKNLIEHKTLFMTPRTRVPKDFYVVNLKRKYFLLYCLTHNVVWLADPVK